MTYGKQMIRLASVGAIACIALVSGAAWGQQEAPIATMTPAGTSVMWVAQAAAADTVLTVSGPDVAIRQLNRGGSSPTLSLSRADGSSLPDGTYTWELRESFAGINDRVSDPANGRDRVDAASAPARVEVKGRVQSGVFTVNNGLVVDDTVQEADQSRPGKGNNS